MNDNAIITIIRNILLAGFAANSMANVRVRHSYQPTKTGVPTAPTVFIHKISANRYGHPGRASVYNMANRSFDYTESIWRTPVFQVDALSLQDPSDLTLPTASDLVELAADILQTEATRQTLLTSNIGIERIQNVRQSYFVDDRDNHEQSPSFDFTLSFRRTFVSTAPEVTERELNVNRV